MNIRKALAVVVFLLISSAVKGAENSLSAEDIAKIKRVHSKYEEAWLKGDADGVRALFTEDCVLLPPHGDKPRIGQKGLNEYWFPPDGPPTKITKLIVTPQGIGGDGQIAYVWGTHDAAWTTEQNGKTTSASHKGIFLNVLEKQANGEWKMSHHMWDEGVEHR
jgi:uncharacterized protein (TIGR02246 family)